MSGKFNLMLITEPWNIKVEHWGKFLEGLENVLNYTHGDATLGEVFSRIISGQYQLYIAFYENKYVGFMTTRFEDHPQGDKFMNVLHVYIKPNTPRDMWTQAYKELEKLAIKYGYNKIRMWTEREKGWARKLEKEGWKPMYTEFIKEVE